MKKVTLLLRRGKWLKDYGNTESSAIIQSKKGSVYQMLIAAAVINGLALIINGFTLFELSRIRRITE